MQSLIRKTADVSPRKQIVDAFLDDEDLSKFAAAFQLSRAHILKLHLALFMLIQFGYYKRVFLVQKEHQIRFLRVQRFYHPPKIYLAKNLDF